MVKPIDGKAYVLGDNIDTDQIIPAQHLVYDLNDPDERKMYGVNALSGVPEELAGLPKGLIPFIKNNNTRSDYQIIIAGKNFGCGSSREHAPVALEIAGIRAVVARSYARIFYRNAIDGAFLVPFECGLDLSKEICTDDLVSIDREKNVIKNLTQGKSYQLNPLGEVAYIVDAGGLFQYAKKIGMIQKPRRKE